MLLFGKVLQFCSDCISNFSRKFCMNDVVVDVIAIGCGGHFIQLLCKKKFSKTLKSFCDFYLFLDYIHFNFEFFMLNNNFSPFESS